VKRRILTTLKIAASLTLLGTILVYSGPREVVAAFQGMRPTLVVLAFVLLLGDSLVRTLNWFQLARSAGCAIRLGAIANAYFAGGFIGALLPSTLGTDLARSAVAAARTRAPVEVLLATTVLLNVLSLAVVCAIGLIVSLMLAPLPGAPQALLVLSAVVAGACLSVIVLLSTARRGESRAPLSCAVAPTSRWVATGVTGADHNTGLGSSGAWRMRLSACHRWIDRRMGRFLTALAARPSPRALVAVSAVASSSYALRTLGWLVLLTAAGAQLPWAVLLAIGPLVTIGAALPISVLGFGGFQAINVYLLSLWGVPPEQALAASLVQSGLSVLLYGIGCIAWLRRAPIPHEPMQPHSSPLPSNGAIYHPVGAAACVRSALGKRIKE